jgi:hypothetical protein
LILSIIKPLCSGGRGKARYPQGLEDKIYIAVYNYIFIVEQVKTLL